MPPAYFLAAIVCMILLHFLLPIRFFLRVPLTLLGLLPLAAGVVLNLLADRWFKKMETTVKPFRDASTLITGGPYRLSRHPMYLGMSLCLLGVWLLLGSVSPAIPFLLFPVVIEALFIPTEEADMERLFGEAYRQYKGTTRRWI